MGLAGGCMCGAVRYEADGEPFHPTLCHCRDCRRASGAPALAWFSVRRDALRWVQGTPALRRSSAWFSVRRDALRWVQGTPALRRSSPGAERQFCAACGTQLTWRGDAVPDEVDVTVGSLDDPDAVVPLDHTFFSQRVRWLHLGDTWARYPGLPERPA